MSMSGQTGRHSWKIGSDAILRDVNEQFSYRITNPDAFDPGTQPSLRFRAQHWDSEPAAFVQDDWHGGHWNVAAGIRYDNYSFVLHRDAWSPRLAVSRYVPAAHTVLHASYDRIFQLPSLENLLLASSPQLDSVSPFMDRLPVEPSHANNFEVGFSSDLAAHLRFTGNVFWRRYRNYADDDTLLNTGISFPFTDRSARIHGEEISILLPEWRSLSAELSYSNQVGTARGPITGGLLLGDEATDALTRTNRFPYPRTREIPFAPICAGVHRTSSGLRCTPNTTAAFL